MIATLVYSLKEDAYTAYRIPSYQPVGIVVAFEQITGYHTRRDDAFLAVQLKGAGFDHVGTVTGRFANRRPETQDTNTRRRPKKSLLDIDYSPLEQRTMAHYHPTATETAETRDKFFEMYPGVKRFWDEIAETRAKTPVMGPEDFKRLHMQEPLPPDDIRAIDPDDKGPLAAREDQRKPTPGRRKGPSKEDRHNAQYHGTRKDRE